MTNRRHQDDEDSVDRFREEANWSGFTNEWSRQFRGRARWARNLLLICIGALLVASIIGVIVSFGSSK